MTIKMITFQLMLSAALLPVILGEWPIDWTKCFPPKIPDPNDSSKMIDPPNPYRCFCYDPNPSRPELRKMDDTLTTDEIVKLCEANGIQIKAISEDVTLYRLQETADNDVKPTADLALYRGDKIVFGCKYNGGQVEVMNMEGKTYASDFDQRSNINGKTVICSLKVTQSSDLTKVMNAMRGDTKMISSTTTVDRKTSSKEVFQPSEDYYTCNPYAFKNLEASNKYFVKRVIHRDEETITCKNYGPRFTMRYANDGHEDEIERIECKKNDMEEFTLRYFKNDPLDQGTEIANPESYAIYCAAKFEEMCQDPMKCDRRSKKCPVYSDGEPSKPAELKCDGKKWLINQEYFVLKENPKCKRDTMKEKNEAAFYFTFESGSDKRVEADQVSCFQEYDCKNKSRLLLPQCEKESDTCGLATQDNGMLKCVDPEKRLKIDNKVLNITSFACNNETGKWENSAYPEGYVRPGTKIVCIKEGVSLASKSAEGMSDTTVYLIMGGSVLGALVVVLACFYLLRWLCLRKAKKRIASTAEWKKLKKEQKQEICKNLFNEVTNSEPGDDILAGMRMIELLLETETEHILCYDCSEYYLMRLQGALLRIDSPISHMFSRYMYLQAKKIIDKHGWIATTPITKNNGKGLHRNIALFLLQFALGDRCNEDAEEFIFDGFQKLGFNAVEQYPHCGMLWPLLLAALPYPRVAESDKLNATLKRFDIKNMHLNLENIAFKAVKEIPEEDRIPSVGSIAQQAAFALGGTPSQFYLKANSERILTELDPSKAVGVSLAYYKGIMYSISRNPTQNIIEACSQWPKVNSDFLDRMYKAFGDDAYKADKVIDTTNYIVTCYGHTTDAKRLSTRLTNRRLDDVEGETNTNAIKIEQEKFEAAIEDELNKIREWFAKRTDIEKLKKKPVHLKRSKGGNKVDNRIVGDKPKKVVTGGTLSNTKSGSESKSKSSEGTDKARTPAAAASSPAASPAPSPAAAATTPSDATPVATPTQAPAP